MPYEITTRLVEPQPTAVVRRRARLSELSKVVPEACGEVWGAVKTLNLPRPGRNLALYLSIDELIQLEVGVEMTQPFVGNDKLISSTLPGGLVATAIHLGPYQQLGQAHTAIRDWCAANGHPLAGPNWEIYDHWQEAWNNDPSRIRTDLFYLLR